MSHRKRMLRHGPRTGVLAASISALIAAGGVSNTALGQDDDEDDSRADETVVVTGTRIRRDDYTATNATTVITQDEMRALGVFSVADMISQLPSNVASTTDTTDTDGMLNFGMEVANLRGLNTASGSRTLVLVDGSRFVPTTSSGAVDLNMIPTALVGQIETVTGGASATYGADAMAGVINVVLDNNIEGIRVDLGYGTDDYGDGDEINLSLGTGFEVLNRRGRVTLGYDHSTSDAIPDCTSRDFCARSLGLLQNGDVMFGVGRAPGTELDNVFFEDQPHYVLVEGMRYTRIPQGMFLAGLDVDDPGTPADEGQYLMTAAEIAARELSGDWDNAFSTIDPAGMGFTRNGFGTYTFTDDGTGVLPYLDVGPDGQPLSPGEYGFVVSQGSGGITPYGSGSLQWENVPLRSENERDNLFTQFSYYFENGVSLTTNLSYGKSTSESPQNSQRNSNWAVSCVFPDNAYLDPQSGATEALRQLHAQRSVWIDVNMDGMQDDADAYNPFLANPVGGSPLCRPGPFLGQSYLDDGETTELYDFPEQVGTAVGGIAKDVSPFTNRYQTSVNETTNLRIGARGDLFDGGSWTWDVNMTYGFSEREQRVTGQPSNRRREMAVHSVWEDDGSGAVCAINSNNIYDGVWRSDNPDLVGFDVPEYQTVVDPGTTVGEYYSEKWRQFISSSLGDQSTPDLVENFFSSMAAGCAPLNPFGLQMTPESVAYAWPTLVQGSENDQLSIDANFSGEIWRGVGAGPFQMAGGVTWRENTTDNFADPNPFNARDFDERFSDPYQGLTEAADAYVEFDLPLLRDKIAADYLSFNLGYRKTENTTERAEGEQSIVTERTTRDIDSWKASMVWRPLDILMVRATRSADTRAPSAEELFSTSRPVLTTGANQERSTPFRANINGTEVNESLDFYDEFSGFANTGGNSLLEEEISTTQTLGLVFTPTELLSGLSASIDYYETHIKGGVEQVSATEVLDNCAVELIVNSFEFPAEYQFCNNVLFDLDLPDTDTQDFLLPDLTADGVNDDPDGGGFFGGPETAPYPEIWIDSAFAGIPEFQEGQPNPFLPFNNIVGVSPSQRNAAPYTSRGIDISVSYNTQLGGGGSLSARVLVSRALEQEVETADDFAESQGIPGAGATALALQNATRNVAGQTGSNGISNSGDSSNWLVPLFSNYSPTPRISGNMFMTYRKNAFSVTGQVRYIGSGKLSNQRLWYGPGQSAAYITNDGIINVAPWAPGLNQTITNNDLPSWATLNVNLEYDFSRSRMQMDRFESLRVYLNVTNIGDRVPDFFSGSGSGGVNTTFFNTQGRTYSTGVRMQF